MTRLKLWLGLAVGAVWTIWGVFLVGRREGRQNARVDAMEGDLKAHERITHADTGLGASDDDNVKWLSDFSKRNSR